MSALTAPKTGFKPGNTAAVGNRGPAGRAQQQRATQTLISVLNERTKAGTGKDKLYEVCDALVNNAIGGDVTAQKYIMDRLDGTPTQMMGEDPAVPLRRPVFIVQASAGVVDGGAAAQVTVQSTEDGDGSGK